MLKNNTYLIKILAVISLIHLTNAQSQDIADLQPCPSSLAKTEVSEPAPNNRWEITLSPYTYHWHDNTEHRPVFLGAMDRKLAGDRFCGLALFRNSFGQPASYVYVGQRWDDVAGQAKLFTKVSVGVISGYKGKYQDKIPLNRYGVAPALIPSVGYDFKKNESVQAMLLGRAGILFAYGRSF